jgi:hypothetical protein
MKVEDMTLGFRSVHSKLKKNTLMDNVGFKEG